MAVLVLKTCTIVANGVDLSDRLQEFSLDLEKEVKDSTCFGSTSKTKVLGLADTKISATFLQDYESGKTDATLWGIYNAGTAVTITGKPTSAAASATNPFYSVSALLPQYSPIKGKIGDLATVQVTFEGTGDVSRATSS
jgi:hypothetical protein